MTAETVLTHEGARFFFAGPSPYKAHSARLALRGVPDAWDVVVTAHFFPLGAPAGFPFQGGRSTARECENAHASPKGHVSPAKK